MKKALIIMICIIASMNANAQLNEITIDDGVAWVHRASDESASARTVGLGYNYIRRWREDSNMAIVFGAKAFYGRSKSTINSQTVKEHFVRFQIPLSLKYVFMTKRNLGIEPYAGADASYFLIGKSKMGNTKYDWFKTYNILIKSVNRAHFGLHAGIDFSWSCMALGLKYQRDLTDFGAGEHFSMLEFKLAYRF